MQSHPAKPEMSSIEIQTLNALQIEKRPLLSSFVECISYIPTKYTLILGGNGGK